MTWRRIKHKSEVRVGSVIGLRDRENGLGRYMTKVHKIEDNKAWGFWSYEKNFGQKKNNEKYLYLDDYITDYYILDEKKSSYDDPDYADLWV